MAFTTDPVSGYPPGTANALLGYSGPGSGSVRPVIDRSYPLAGIVQAYRSVETGQKIGNVVITVEQE